MGQIVFASVNANGGSFVAKNEELPSHINNVETLEQIKKMDEEYNKLVKSNDMLKYNINNLEEKYKKSLENIKAYKDKIENEKYKRQYSEKEIIRLKNEKEYVAKELKKSVLDISRLEKEVNIKNDEKLKLELEKIKNLNASYEKNLKELNENIIYQNDVIENASNEINEKEKLINENEIKNVQLQKENENYKRDIALKNEKIVKTEKIRKKELEEKWNLHYPKFEIKAATIRDAVKFSKKEIWEIERALNELHSLNDYKSVSRGKIKDNGYEYEHMGFSLPCGFPTRILYIVTNNYSKKVIIEKIYKHNEKIYQ